MVRGSRANLLIASLALWTTLAPGVCFSAIPEKQELTITDPSSILYLEGHGFALHELLGVDRDDNSSLLKHQGYAVVRKAILDVLHEQQPKVEEFKATYKFDPEVFREGWLESQFAHFELVAVVHRPDRDIWIPGSCGEVRAIYRLAYRSPKADTDPSRLPMTLSLIFEARDLMPQKKCADIAALMIIPSTKSKISVAKNYVATTALGRSVIKNRHELKRMEINVQTSRWPTQTNGNLADQSHYLLMTFHKEAPAQEWQISTLENMPDVLRIQQSPQLKNELQTFLSEPSTQQDIRQGSFLLPKKFLATKAVSVAPFGLSRIANRPFTELFQKDGRVPEETLLRLDTLTCVGCHQSRAIAGFHVLGHDTRTKFADYTNRSPFSAYFLGIQKWRNDYIRRLRYTSFTPLPRSDRINEGGIGDSCSKEPTLYGCQSGLICDAAHTGNDTKHWGQCVTNSKQTPGDSCDLTQIITSQDPLKDHYKPAPPENCGEQSACGQSVMGFPGGYCAASCERKDIHGLCVAVPLFGPFTTCVLETRQFRKCARAHSVKVQMAPCQTSLDCRRDYACAAATADQGLCVAPYFLPDLTLTHHPDLPL